MNLSGYVQLRRGLLEHIQDGRLSSQEFAAFTVLTMLADKETGSGRINAPVLTSWLPDMSYDAAKRVLLSLESKRYLFREVVPFSKRMYRFWINKYLITDGPHRLLQINLSKVFDSKDPKDIEYLNPALQGAPQGALQGAPQGAPQGALHNKKEKDKDKEKETLPSKGTCALRELDDALNVSTDIACNVHTSGEAREENVIRDVSRCEQNVMQPDRPDWHAEAW